MRLERLAIAALVCGFAAPAAAEYQVWDYKDWRAVAETVDTGEDVRVTCSARTGGDGDPTLVATLSNGDAMPPYGYPSVIIEESAPRGTATLMRDGDRINFLFDDGDSAEATAFAGHDEDGIPVASAMIDAGDSLRVLQAMQRAGQLEILRGRDIVYTASLNGFTAAYGKMAEACGFDTVGVIE